MYSATPLLLSSNIFDANSIYRTLYFPAGSKYYYEQSTIWNKWCNIINEMAPAGLFEQSLNPINIYPNPVIDGFQISGLEGDYTLTIIDLKGNTILTKQAVDN